jgi:hypothetical protein
MGCILAILRPVAALVLGVIVFFGFLFLLLVTNFSDKLLSADFYTDTVLGENTYNRIYDDVLLDKELERTTQDLLGGVQVVSQEEIVGLLREIIPPEYLQSETEGAVQRTVDYFNDDRENLDLYVDVGPPLDNVKTVIFRYIDQRIDGLAEEDLGRLACTTEGVNEVAGLYQERWEGLSGGKVPSSIPSLATFESGCRLIIFELAFDNLVTQVDLDERSKQGLGSIRGELRDQFVAGEAKEVLKIASRPLAEPVIDDAIQQVREELDDQNRLDLIRQIAIWNDDFTESDLRSDLDKARDWINWGQRFGKELAQVMVILGSVLLGLIHYPSLKNGLRWPGLSLLLTGAAFFATGKVLESQVPDRLKDLVDRGADQVVGVPPSVTDLGGDLLISFGQQLTSDFAGPALAVLIIGALLFGASFFINYVMFLLRLILLPLRLVLGGRRGDDRRNDSAPTNTLGTGESQSPGG